MTHKAKAVKPCPFCGGQPTITEDDSYGGCSIGCSGCDVEPSVLVSVGQLDQAIEKWNQRAPDREAEQRGMERAAEIAEQKGKHEAFARRGAREAGRDLVAECRQAGSEVAHGIAAAIRAAKEKL